LKIPEKFSFLTYELILSWDCNLACSYCYEKNKNSSESIGKTFDIETTEKTIRFIEQTYDRNSRELFFVFFGGEPLLYFEKMKEFVDKILLLFENMENRPVINFCITTNLTEATVTQLDFMISRRFSFLVSLDGTQFGHDVNRGNGNFFRTINNLAYLYAKKANTKIRATINKSNLLGFKENFLFLNSLQLPFIWFFDTSIEYTIPEMENFLKDLHVVYDNNVQNNDTTLDIFLSKRHQSTWCIDPYRTISVRYDGKLIICSHTNWEIGDLDSGLQNLELFAHLPLYNKKQKAIC